jgi:hypothetical protein
MQSSIETFYLEKSINKKKKYSVYYINENNTLSRIDFGASGYGDYTLTNSDIKKKNYRSRHRHDPYNDMYTPAFWSWHLLWNRKSIIESIKDIISHYNINIINAVK